MLITACDAVWRTGRSGRVAWKRRSQKWRKQNRPGSLTTNTAISRRAALFRTRCFAFPRQRKEPLTDAAHVRNAVALFDQVIDVSDADRALAFANIEKAASHYDVDLSETDWHQLGIHPQPRRGESASRGAETRMRTGEAEEAARKGAATRERLGIAEEAAKKAAETRRREREENEGR